MSHLDTRKCEVCLEILHKSKFATISASCRHNSVCRECICDLIKNSQARGDGLPCPVLNCKHRLTRSDIDFFLPPADFKIWEEKATLFRWDAPSTLMVQCSTPDCGMAYEVVNDASFFTCLKCTVKTCIHHKIKMHEGKTCSEYDENPDATNEYMRNNTKNCPKCSTPCAKIDDKCDHVMCACNHHFCWSCLADHKLILNTSNHNHKDTCRHYAPLPQETQ